MEANRPAPSQLNSPSSKRYFLLDTLRGLTLINMLLYHFLWDLVYIADVSIPWYHSRGAHIWQQSICRTFILLSGFCWSFGKSPLKRGLQVFWGGGLITLITMLLMPENLVLFGILTLLGSCMILMIPVDFICSKISNTVLWMLLLLAALAAFAAFYPGQGGYANLANGNLFTAYLGFPGTGFYSTDYFPLLPWFFLFLAGYALHKISLCFHWLEADFLTRKIFPPLTFMGQHCLLIYMLHQPVLYGITLLIAYFK